MVQGRKSYPDDGLCCSPDIKFRIFVGLVQYGDRRDDMKDTIKKIKVWITKFALTHGIEEVEVAVCDTECFVMAKGIEA